MPDSREDLQRDWNKHDELAKHYSALTEEYLQKASDASQTASRARQAMLEIEQEAARQGWLPFSHAEPERGGEL